MSLYYKSEITFPIFGSVALVMAADRTTISTATRTSIAITNAYQAEAANKPTKSFATDGYAKLNLDILYTMGAAETSNSIELKIEGSPDGINFYRIPNESVSGGTSTLTAREFTFVGVDAAATTISIGLDIFYKFMRVSGKETGVASNAGTIFCQATLAGL